jgi:hypothetical protein
MLQMRLNEVDEIFDRIMVSWTIVPNPSGSTRTGTTGPSRGCDVVFLAMGD